MVVKCELFVEFTCIQHKIVMTRHIFWPSVVNFEMFTVSIHNIFEHNLLNN